MEQKRKERNNNGRPKLTMEERAEAVRAMWPHMSGSEIEAATGIPRSTVRYWAHRLGLAHTPETWRRLRHKVGMAWTKNGRMCETAEQKAARVRRWKLNRRIEELRILSGEPRKTGHIFKELPRRIYLAKWRLIHFHGCEPVAGDAWTLLYDPTREHPLGRRHDNTPEAIYRRHGLRLVPKERQDPAHESVEKIVSLDYPEKIVSLE